jgi:5-dehydro-2-deoxygluconokinase
VADELEENMTPPGPRAGAPEVVVLGRISADLYPAEIRVPLAEQRNYVRYLGGFAGNVSTALARLQVRTAIVSRVGDDGHGRFVRSFLEQEGVDVGWLGLDRSLNTPVVFCEIWPPDRFPLLFYRNPTCPDWELSPDEINVAAIAEAPILLASGTGLAREKSRAAHTVALEGHRHTAIFDLDYRPSFWESPAAYRRAVRAVLPLADVVVGNEDEVCAASGLTEPRQAIKALGELGPTMLILKRGGAGAVLFDGERVQDVPPVQMTVVNGLGAGDAFLGTVTHGLLRGIDAGLAVQRGAWSGAYVASQVPCSEAMPFLRQLDAAVPAVTLPSSS